MVINLSKSGRGGARKGAGRIPLKENEKRKGVKIYITDRVKEEIVEYGDGKSFSDKALDLIESELKRRKEL